MHLVSIPLDQLKGLNKRVRQQMSPEKLEELSDSIKELGQIVPVKVRKNGEGYTLIYGHRRVMAAKAAGFKEIEAIVEDVPDKRILAQSLAENVVREDMSDSDKGAALLKVKEDTGASNEQIGGWYGHRGEAGGEWVRSLIAVYNMVKTQVDLGSTLTTQALHEASAGTGGDTKLAAKVLEKAAKEELSTRETRKVAEVVRHASEFGGDRAVKRVLSQPAARIIETAASLPERPRARPKSTPIVKESKALFQWVKDPQVMIAEDGIGAARTVIAAIARGDRDPQGGKVVLRRLKKLLELSLKETEAALR